MVQVLVINLNRSPDRLARIDGMLRDIGVGFERITACDGKAMSEAERNAWMDARPRDGRARWLPGQIGCFESHMLAWRRIAESNDRVAIVLEDDLHFSNSLRLLTKSEDWWPEDADVVRLETTLQGMKLGPAIYNPGIRRDLHALRSEAWGAGAYAIRREAAAWLAATPVRLLFPPDIFLYNQAVSLRARGLKTFQVNPAIAIQDKFIEQSSSREGIESLIDDPRDAAKTQSKLWNKVRIVGRALRGRTLVPQA